MADAVTASDGGLRAEFRKRIPHWHWQSIETGGTGKGVPDSNFCHESVEGWIEFKQTGGWACTLKPEQVGWLLRRARAGGRVLVGTRRWCDAGPRRGAACDELWLHLGRHARELKIDGLRAAPALGVWTGGPARWDWSRIAALVLGAG